MGKREVYSTPSARILLPCGFMRYLALFGLLAASAWTQTPQFRDPNRLEKLKQALPEVDKIFARYYEQRQTPGLVYGLVVDGQLVHTKSFGVLDVEAKAPVTEDTAFRIASMTKSFTVLAVLKLRDAGKLSLEDPASKYIPEMKGWKLPTKDSGAITVRTLLTHGAGFPEDNPWGDRQLAIPDKELGKWLDSGVPFSNVPDSHYEYSNYGFALLGRIVQKASGKPYAQYLEAEILKPLGLTSSTLEAAQVPAAVRAKGYGRRDDKLFEIPSLAHGSFGAMGGLHTTAKDMAKYVAFHLAAYPPRDEDDAGPVKRASVREMSRLQRLGNFAAANTGSGPLRATAGGYGFGLGVSSDCKFEHIVGHGGGLPGYGSYMMWLPEYGVGMFAMTNLTYSGPSAAIRESLDALDKTGGLEKRQLPPSPALAATQAAVNKLIERWSNAEADALAADNLYLDKPRAAYQAELEKLRSSYTGCNFNSAVEPENWLRGEYKVACREGDIRVSFTLAPTQPPKVQYLAFNTVPKLVDVELTARLKEAAASSPYGACQVGEVIAGDGKTRATAKLQCPNGAATLTAVLNEGKLTATFGRAPGNACTP